MVIDGNLDEKEWQKAAVLDEFTTIVPFNFEDPKLKTTVKIFSNAEGIYVGFINEQDQQTIRQKNHIRDSWDDKGDKNGVTIDFDGNSKVAYGFTVSLGGSISDATYRSGNRENTDWDGDWLSATSRNNDFWTTEIFIPWSIAPMQSVESKRREIGFIAWRWYAQEQSSFATAKTNYMRNTFIYDLPSLEIDNYSVRKNSFFPYITLSEDIAAKQKIEKIGVDIFLNRGNGNQTNLAINPDFGQVETDEVVVNFSAIETFFSEKRAFFTENQTLFEVRGGRDDFYVINTRRIGSKPIYQCESTYDEDLCNNSQQEYSELDIALRHTSQQKNFDYGFLSASESDSPFTKGKDFYAFRIRSNNPVNKIGLLSTRTVNNFVGNEADVIALDIENTAINKTKISGAILNSKTANGSGNGLRFDIKYFPKIEYENTFGFQYFDKKLDLNDMGYLQRNDEIKAYNRFEFDRNSFPIESLFKSRQSHISIFQSMTTDGKKSPRGLWTRTELWLKSNASIEVSMSIKNEGKNSTFTRKNEVAQYINVMNEKTINLDFDSPRYKKWSFGGDIGYSRAGAYPTWGSDGNKRNTYRFGVSYFPNEEFQLYLGSKKIKEQEWLKWVEANRLGAFTKSQRNLDFTMTFLRGNKHELRLKNQIIMIKANNPISLEAQNTGEIFASDFELQPFNLSENSLQIRYRYEFAPLSYFYLVYTRADSFFTNDDLSNFDSLLESSWKNPGNEILTAKIRLKF